MLLSAITHFVIVTVVFLIILAAVPSLHNLKYMKVLRSAHKAIKSGDFKVDQKETYHIDEFTMTMDKVEYVSSIEFKHDNSPVIGYIDPNFNKVKFVGESSVLGRTSFYIDPERIYYPSVIGTIINSFTYNIYGKKVESFLHAADDAMRI